MEHTGRLFPDLLFWFIWNRIKKHVVYYESMKRNYENLYMSVGVMEDYKLRDLRASHTLGSVVDLRDKKGLQ
jgi:hypothetical protein